MRISEMRVQNFKNIKDYPLTLNGKSASIYGENHLGKTPLADAWLWLMTGKNSQGDKDFEIKPLDSENRVIPGLCPTVEAKLLLDSENDPLGGLSGITLKRQLVEKWTKNQKTHEKEFTGNETLYWVNDVPVKAGEFQAEINKIIDEKVFKLVTNPKFFCTDSKEFSWTERRAILMSFCPELSIDEVILASPAGIEEIKDFIGIHSPEDYLKMVKEKLKGLEKDKAGIEPGIQALMQSVGEKVDYADTERLLAVNQQGLDEIEKKLVSAGTAQLDYKRRLQELTTAQAEAENIKKCIERAGEEEAHQRGLEISRGNIKVTELKEEIEGLTQKGLAAGKELQDRTLYREKLLKEWKEIKAHAFTSPDNLDCPSGDDCPYQSKALEEAQAKYELQKANNFIKNKTEGLEVKQEIETWEKRIKAIDESKFAKEKELAELKIKLTTISAHTLLPPKSSPLHTDNEYLKARSKYELLKSQLAEPVKDQNLNLLQEKQQVQAKIYRLQQILAGKTSREKTLQQIEELKVKERTLAQEIMTLEGQKFVCDEFIKAKVRLLETSINAKFDGIRFKMFEQQVNGDVVPCCIALSPAGVPFPDQGNSEQTKNGLNVINVLAELYKVSVPCFIDDAEHISNLPPISGQAIKLYVSPEDKEFRVEVA